MRAWQCIALLLAAGAAFGGELSDTILRYQADRRSVGHVYMVCGRGPFECFEEPSPARRARLRAFYQEWQGRLQQIDFDKLDQEGRIDYLLLANQLRREQRRLDLEAKRLEAIAPAIPFAPAILELEAARRRVEPIDGAKAAAAVSAIATQVRALRTDSNRAATKGSGALRAARETDKLRAILANWFTFYNGYDPLFTWWVEAPYKETAKALEDYAVFLRETVAGLKPGEVAGDPIGSEALRDELKLEMISYTPEELIGIAKQEAAWCEAELKKAAQALGYGDDWHKALEHVKSRHVEPGRQPALIRDLAQEAVDFIEKRNLVTVPPLVREDWRIEMMSPERQKVNPFFTGGDDITVSYPVNAMSQDEKLMSMRGNNIAFARATVFHELIPGHHMQFFMAERYHPYRQVFSTPFYGEGWSVYWEMVLWDLGFQRTPEERIGALFWRLHRCARIVFSLSFHLGTMSSQDCIEYLVSQVGHERANAVAEVRRSLDGDDGPLYQAAYMVGALQMRALRRELKMPDKEFHDAVLHENSMPIELVRAALTKQKLSREFQPAWRFYEDGRSR